MNPATLRAWIDRLPKSKQLGYVRSYQGPHARAICHLLLEEAWEKRSSAEGSGLWIARLAVVLAERFSLAQELRKGLLVYGNALRVSGRLSQAGACFLRSDELGLTVTSEERVFELSVRASLLRELGEHQAACDLIDDALRIREGSRDYESMAALLVQKAVVEAEYSPLSALRSINRALSLIEPARTRLYLLAHHNAAEIFCLAGRPAMARRILAVLDPLYEEVDDFALHANRWLVSAHVEKQLGLASLAEASFLRAVATLEAKGPTQALGFALLEYSQLLVEIGRNEEAVQLVSKAVGMIELKREQRMLRRALQVGLSAKTLAASTERLRRIL